MKELYKKYINWIVCILFTLWCGSSCKRCSLERRIDWNESKYEISLDSLKSTNVSLNEKIDSLNNELILYKYKVVHLENAEKSLKESNKYLRSSNKELIKNTLKK